ncbi:MAG TPA: acyl-CoA dehydrogenase family protein [Vicinamibacterales bacterium]|nr:acyl-CoA dehydrogenase family protein [Vicinamibacterales bacterium]HOQ59916.1 acyl-CoA dehydrogenase family protein [Vicinamibacterales bacterium]HPK71543.1 acyl-CoA dehydrogenase family protein [Vicinamibacterales bacterium]
MELKRLSAGDLDLILKTLKEFTDREAPLDKRLKWDETDTCPEPVVRAMLGPDVGLHLVFLPADHGGMGGGAYDVYRLSAEFAKIDLGLATAMLAVALGTDPIRVGCTETQKAAWLPRIADEGLVVAYGVTEPEAGSNVQSLKTEAARITDADGRTTHYRLNGVKQFISNGSIADLYTILAKAPDGPTFFVVERGTPGLSPGRHEIKHGIRLSNTAQVVLQDVVVPAANLVGEREGEGLKQANEVFGFTRLMVAAFGLGAGQAALQKAVAYSTQRRQFGTFLAQKQGFTHKLLVPDSVRLAAAQAYIEHVADLLDSGNTDRQVEGSIAKLFATEAANAAADHAVQALGGYGYCVDFEVEKIRRDARILTIYEGTSEIQQSIIGLFRMRETVRSKGAFYCGMADEIEAFADAGGPAAARAARFLAEATQAAFRAKAIRQQHVSFEFATAMAEVETAVALARAAARAGASRLLKAQSRLWAAWVSLGVPVRLLAALNAAGSLGPDELARLRQAGDFDAGLAAQSGGVADMNLVAEELTGFRVAE